MARRLRLAIETREMYADRLARRSDPGDDISRQQRDEIARLDGIVAELEAAVGERRTFRFEDLPVQFLHDQLTLLVAGLEEFVGADGALADVKKRLAWAQSVERESLGEHADSWDTAVAAIRSSDGVTAHRDYAHLELAPQLGLVPVGMDPRSKLWEFVHLRSGTPGAAIPARDPDTGVLAFTEDTGIVFVLVPGATFTMGAQAEDAAAPRFDAMAEDDEVPVHTVALSAFFLSKYEMTQGQWLRLTGENPSLYVPMTTPGEAKPVTPRNPVEFVDWFACDQLLTRHGLVIPTEAQWEYACRAGTDTPWYCGREKGSLQGHANLADRFANSHTTWECDTSIDDGHVVHAPVGSFAPNPFGLHDMHGNLWEWCRDSFGLYDRPAAPLDGLRQELVDDRKFRILRGGCYFNPPQFLRSSERFGDAQKGQNATYGVRPARALRS